MPFLYQFKWLPQFYKFTNAFSDDAFYWSVYIPLMKEILAEHVHKEVGVAHENKETTYHARIHQNQYEIWMNDTWQPMTLKGVNMGIAKPGYFPGETAITEEEYFQWFTQIGELNANVIRVYTLHPPDFYRALKRYNEQYEQKLYLIHGVWADEEPLEKLLDAFNESIVTNFQGEINKIVDAIHGNTIIEHQPGHASGVYSDDISEYVIGWILGIEWSPFMVEHTNQVHKGLEDFQGNYFETKNAEPFEIWLAQQMETIFAYELETYQSIRPISFTNWPTTDILDHPSDATENEDFASVDPNVIYTKNEAELTGQFASYHVYPYYPDFLNFDEKYTSYVDHRGEKNNYAGYLNELRDAHRLPILIAEFGVPASRGLTHENIYGWNQGFLTEKEQGDIVVRLYEDILAEGLMGGILFTWQDEWFKRTWNTMDYDNPDRRPYWSNAQTNEQQFGILSFDRHKIKVDGQTDDWEQEPIYQKNEGILKSLTMDHDERYVYFKIELNETGNGYPAILLDTLPNQGNNQISFLNDLSFHNGIEFFIRLNQEQPRILIDQYYDQFTYQYGYLLEMIEVPEEQPKNNSGQFIPMHYALNKEYYNPEKEEVYEFSSYETGYLRHGNGNPESAEYDSLADYYFNEKKGIVELRIPWLLLQAKDPSRKEFTGNVYENGIEASEFIEQIFVGLLYIEDDEAADTLPQSEDGKVREFKHYTWDNWELPQYESRLKQSYDIIQELFKSIDKK